MQTASNNRNTRHTDPRIHGQSGSSSGWRTMILFEGDEHNFSGRLVDLVSREYPCTAEEASVLLSRVWNLIEDEILAGISTDSCKTKYLERIGTVSIYYNVAVQQLSEMNRNLLRYGAVADYFRSF